MLTSWSEVSTPALLSMASVLTRTPASAASMRPSWLAPRLPPSPTTLQRRSPAVDADGVVGAVADLGVGLGGGLDVGADAAVPQQVDRREEDRLHQVGGRHRLRARAQAEGRDHLRADGNGLGRPREDATALADELLVVVGPGRPRQVEHPPALGIRRGGVGVGVDEDVPVVEGRDEADVLGQEHAVAEDVAAHVPDADDRELLGLGVDAELAEVALDRLPGAAGGDAHALVVVAGRAAGREGVVEPEAVVARQAVGDVGELRRALVGGDDEVRVVLVVAHDPVRRDGLARHEVVGEVEQARR